MLYNQNLFVYSDIYVKLIVIIDQEDEFMEFCSVVSIHTRNFVTNDILFQV